MRPIRSIVTVAMVGLAGTLGVASAAALPVAANAAVHASVSSAVGSSHAAPANNIQCPNHMTHWVAWYGTCATYVNHSCTANNEGNMSPPSYASNDCGNNVYLYTQTGEQGTHLCVAGQSRTYHLNTQYHSYRVIVGGC